MRVCSLVRRHLSDRVDGRVPLLLVPVVRLHLRICPSCRRVDQELGETVSLLRELRDEPVSR